MIASIEGNLREFNDNLKKEISKDISNKSEFVLEKVKELFFEICDATPIKTGQARSNWYMNVDSPSGSFKPVDKKYRLSAQQVRSINEQNSDISFDILKNNSIWIDNNTDYINQLENGSSKNQAPAGMVAVSLAKFNLAQRFKDMFNG